MSQIIDVATWVALLAGIAGITLSIVAIWFTFAVERRSRSVTEQMIQSLRKIESAVERSSADTQGLIKVAWERMLGGVARQGDQPVSESSQTAITKVAEGLAEEVRADLISTQGTKFSKEDEDRIAQRVQEAVQAQLQSGQRRQTRFSSADRVESWVSTIDDLSSTAQFLIGFLSRSGHINRTEYRQLVRDSKYADAINQLRRVGILVPLMSEGETEENQPVYWFPPGDVQELRIAFELLSPHFTKETHERIEADLSGFGIRSRTTGTPTRRRKVVRGSVEHPDGISTEIASDVNTDSIEHEDGGSKATPPTK